MSDHTSRTSKAEQLHDKLLIADGLVKAAEISSAEFTINAGEHSDATVCTLAALKRYVSESVDLSDELTCSGEGGAS